MAQPDALRYGVEHKPDLTTKASAYPFVLASAPFGTPEGWTVKVHMYMTGKNMGKTYMRWNGTLPNQRNVVSCKAAIEMDAEAKGENADVALEKYYVAKAELAVAAAPIAVADGGGVRTPRRSRSRSRRCSFPSPGL